MLELLDTFIGMVTIYLILSLIVTALGEALSMFLNLRGITLREILSNLLGEPIARQVFAHRNVKSLCSPASSSAAWRGRFRADDDNQAYRIPSYLPSDLFARTLLDILINYSTSCRLYDNKPLTALNIEQALNGPDQRPYQARLRAMWIEAEYDIERFQAAIITWFDHTADRANGWFKRRLGRYLLLSGLLVTALLNADTIQMFKTLSNNDSLRQQFVEKALVLSSSTEAPQDEATAKITMQQIRTAWCTANGIKQEDDAGKKECNKQFNSDLVTALMPVLGWEAVPGPLLQAFCKLPGAVECDDSIHWNEALRALLLKFLGLLLTAAAISMGAPFWFDLLNKIIQVRGKITTSTSTPAAKKDGNKQADTATVAEAPGARSVLQSVSVDQLTFDKLDSFNERNFGYDPVNYYWCARLAMLAYEEPALTLDMLQDFGAGGELIDHGPSGTQCLVAYTPKAIILAFRGTEMAIQDWATNAAFDQADYSALGLNATQQGHQGFFNALFGSSKPGDGNAWTLIAQSIDKIPNHERLPLWLTGHSLGGALAVLAALKLANNAAGIGAIFTFGQPRVGNAQLATFLDSRFPQKYFRSINHRDIVPRVPFVQTFNRHDLKQPHEYAHAGRALYFNDVGKAIMDPPLWYRKIDALGMDLGDEAIKGKLKQLTGDHGMAEYLALHSRLLERTESA
jgi:pimeloyl-ACP methyl ester carboxylesterase